MSYHSLLQDELNEVSNSEVDFIIKTSGWLWPTIGALGAGTLGYYAGSSQEDNYREKVEQLEKDRFTRDLIAGAVGATGMWFAKKPIQGILMGEKAEDAGVMSADEFGTIWKKRRKAL